MSLLRISCNAIESMSGKHQKATCVHIKSAFNVRIFQDSGEPQNLSLETLEYRKSEEGSCGIPGRIVSLGGGKVRDILIGEFITLPHPNPTPDTGVPESQMTFTSEFKYSDLVE